MINNKEIILQKFGGIEKDIILRKHKILVMVDRRKLPDLGK